MTEQALRGRRQRVKLERRRRPFTEREPIEVELPTGNATEMQAGLSAQEDEERNPSGCKFDWNDLRKLLVEGESLIIKQLSTDPEEYIISRVTPQTVALARSKKLAGPTKTKQQRIRRDDLEQFMTPEYKKLKTLLSDMDIKEERSYAEKLGVEWIPDTSERIEHMRIFEALQKHHGIDKWIAGYEEKEARLQYIQLRENTK